MKSITRLHGAAIGAIAVTLALALSSVAHAQTDSVLFVSKAGTTLLRVNSNGNVGIGASSPTVRFQVDAGQVAFKGDDGLVATGTFGVGTIPSSGSGVRMMWYPRKAAFRAGMATSGAWEDGLVGNFSFAAGLNSTASGQSSLAIGHASTASADNSIALGSGSTATAANAIALGGGSATGNSSFAVGTFAHTNGQSGSFVFADANSTTITASATNQFTVRASGGFRFFTDAFLTTGAALSPGSGSWSSLSDRNRKENFGDTDGEDVLTRLRSVPVTTWNYTTQDRAIRHMGPMAQDFHAAFGLGESNLMISSVDIDGVNLAAVQAVAARTDALRARVASLESENAALRERLDQIEALLEGKN